MRSLSVSEILSSCQPPFYIREGDQGGGLFYFTLCSTLDIRFYLIKLFDCPEQDNEINDQKHNLKGDVKSCTYHKMEIKEDNGWTGQVIVDI